MSIPLEILEVKSKNFIHLMNGHGCNDASIVDLDPGDSMLSHECAPSYEKFRGLWQQTENRLKAVKVATGLLWRETETIPIRRPRRHIPELDQVLREAEKLLSAAVERLYSVPCSITKCRIEPAKIFVSTAIIDTNSHDALHPRPHPAEPARYRKVHR